MRIELTEAEDRAVAAFVKLGFSVVEAYAYADCLQKYVQDGVSKLGETDLDLFNEMMAAL